MILLLDIGNSTIGLALVEKDEIIKNYRVATESKKTYDEYFSLISSILNLSKVTNVAISSVVPRVTEQIVKMCKKHLNIIPFVVEVGVKTGIDINTDAPKEVGADLICLAAALNNTSPTIIIDLGTATKLLYCKNNSILGAVITPGIEISHKALINTTALLPEVELKVTKNVLGKNTTECLQSGMTHGNAAMIDGLINKIINECKLDKVFLVGTGGLSSVILPLCKYEILRDPLLIFKGLLKIYKKNLLKEIHQNA